MATLESDTQKKAIHNKANHITNIRYPYAKTWDKHNYYVEFEAANIQISMANAIRRLMISDVKTVGFRTEPYTACDINVIINDTPLHNQMTVHRLAMIPIKTAGISTGTLLVEFSGALQDNKRIYFGPVDIDRMRVKLLDDKGNVVDLHGADWSITLISENLYQY